MAQIVGTRTSNADALAEDAHALIECANFDELTFIARKETP
jgi:hypothetical protein